MAENQGNEVGRAYVNIAPNARGFKAALHNELQDVNEFIPVAVKEMPGKGAAAVLARARELASEKPIEAQVRVGLVRGTLDRLRMTFSSAGKSAGHSFVGGFAETMLGAEGMGSLTSKLTKLGAGAALAGGFIEVFKSGFEQSTGMQNAMQMLEGYGYTAQRAQALLDGATRGLKGTHGALKDILDDIPGAAASGIDTPEKMEKYARLVANIGTINHNQFKESGQLIDKMRDRGTMHTGDIQQLATRGLPIWKWIQDQYHLSEEQAHKQAQKGFKSQDIFDKVLSPRVGNIANTMNHTLDAQMSSVKKNMADLGQSLFSPLVNGATSLLERLNPAFEKLNEWINKFKNTDGFKNFASDVREIAVDIGKLGGALVGAVRAAAPLIGFIGASVWNVAKATIGAIAAAFKTVGTEAHRAGTGLKIVAAALAIITMRSRIAAVATRAYAMAQMMASRVMSMTPWGRVATLAVTAGAAIVGFANKSQYMRAMGARVSSTLSNMGKRLGIDIPEGASISEKAMAVMAKGFDSACSYAKSVVNILVHEVKIAFQELWNFCVHIFNGIKHAYNGVVGVLNKVPGVHLGTVNMTETKNWVDEGSSGSYIHDQMQAAHDRNEQYNKDYNADLRKQAADKAKAEKEAKNSDLAGAGGGYSGSSGGDGGYAPSGGGSSYSGGSGGSRGRAGTHTTKPVDALLKAHSGVAALMNKVQKILVEENNFEKTHNGMKNPQLMKQLVQALQELKKALALETNLKKRATSSSAGAGHGGHGGKWTKGKTAKPGQDGKQNAEEMINIGKEAFGEQFEGTPFSNPLEWKNVKSLDALLTGMGNGLGNAFESLGKPHKGSGTGGGSIFAGQTGKAGVQLSTRQAMQSSAAKSFKPSVGSPKAAPGDTDPFLQFGGSGGGGAGGLLGAFKDATNLKNFISKDSQERLQGAFGGNTTQNGVAGQKPGGNTTFNIHGANAHEVTQKVHRQHNINRAKMHASGRH